MLFANSVVCILQSWTQTANSQSQKFLPNQTKEIFNQPPARIKLRIHSQNCALWNVLWEVLVAQSVHNDLKLREKEKSCNKVFRFLAILHRFLAEKQGFISFKVTKIPMSTSKESKIYWKLYLIKHYWRLETPNWTSKKSHSKEQISVR